MITPHTYFQHPHHSRKIPGTRHFTSYQQHRSAAPLRPVQPHGHNPKLVWLCMQMPLAGAPQDTPVKLYVEARWSRTRCLHCRRWLCQKQRPAAFFFFFFKKYTHTLDKRGTTFPFRGTSRILPWSQGDRAAVLHSAGARKHKLPQKTPTSSISHQKPTACPLTHGLQGLVSTRKAPDD